MTKPSAAAGPKDFAMDYFPLTIATGKAFCNRKTELSYLAANISQSKPTLIVSPRRYGKTSLALNAITQSRLPHARFDFLSAINETDIERCVLKGIGGLISRLETGVRKAIVLATELFSGLDIKVNYGKLGVAIEIDRSAEKPAQHILRILERVDYLARKYKKKVILFFDEFQRISEVAEDHALESVIRQIAQESKDLAFIFSGSNRHLLYKVFDDRSRPLYKLCDRIALERIAAPEYLKYIKHSCWQTWNKLPDNATVGRIIYYTERHPYYMNLLCSKLLKLPALPEVKTVESIWHNYVVQERSQVAAEIELLSKNQRKLLTVLARSNGTSAPRGREFESVAEMSGATITQALDFLEKKDYVFKDEENRYNVLDPLIKGVLSEY
jgi:AAA+ ATPase superfamily predicted ATPase